MSRTRERQLSLMGYAFTGQYASGPEGKTQMKAKAAAWRAQGFFATVVHNVYKGRVYDVDGYSVYKKPKAA